MTLIVIEPIVSCFQRHGGGNKHSFVSGSTNLEIDPILSFELNLFVVDSPRCIHCAVLLEDWFSIRWLLPLRFNKSRFGCLHWFCIEDRSWLGDFNRSGTRGGRGFGSHWLLDHSFSRSRFRFSHELQNFGVIHIY